MTPAWFAALEVPTRVQSELHAYVLPRLAAPFTVDDPGKYHVTVLYIGHVAERGQEFLDVCRRAATEVAPFEIRLGPIRQFIRPGFAVALVTDGVDSLASLWKRIHIPTIGIGTSSRIHDDDDKPRLREPHVTVGRRPKETPADLPADWRVDLHFDVPELVVLASIDGRYERVDTFALMG